MSETQCLALLPHLLTTSAEARLGAVAFESSREAFLEQRLNKPGGAPAHTLGTLPENPIDSTWKNGDAITLETAIKPRVPTPLEVSRHEAQVAATKLKPTLDLDDVIFDKFQRPKFSIKAAQAQMMQHLTDNGVPKQTNADNPSNGGGLRYNAGKLRYDLVPAYAQEQYVRVLSAGARKYADRNWEAGMKWSTVLASMKRHIAAIEKGEDRDPETGELHSAHVMCNAAFLSEYYKIYPQGDDRPHAYLNAPRIGLDIDEVLAGFLEAYCARFGLAIPLNWRFDHQLLTRFTELDGTDFWDNLKPRLNPVDLPFEPVVYITARPLETGVVEWLHKHGFPAVPAVHALGPEGKVAACRAHNVEVFVDDSYDNFVALNRAGICCYLMDAPHNQRYNVGHKRIFTLQDLPFFN